MNKSQSNNFALTEIQKDYNSATTESYDYERKQEQFSENIYLSNTARRYRLTKFQQRQHAK